MWHTRQWNNATNILCPFWVVVYGWAVAITECRREDGTVWRRAVILTTWLLQFTWLWYVLCRVLHRPLSRRLDRCDRVIQDEVGDSNGGNVVTMQITFVTRKFGNVERNSHCDVLHFTPVRVANLVLDCNGVFAIKAYWIPSETVVSIRVDANVLIILAYWYSTGHACYLYFTQ